MLRIAPIFILVLALPAQLPAQACSGDCDGDGVVTVDELIIGVNIALAEQSLEECPPFDTNGDGAVTIDDLIAAVDAALCGCGQPCPTPVPTSTATAVQTATATPTPTAPPLLPSATPTQPIVGTVLFSEGWNTAPLGRYEPDGLLRADSGEWVVGDTITAFPECGSSPQYVEIIAAFGGRALRLHSVNSQNDEGCADNVFVGPIQRNPPGLRNLNIPLTDDLFLSFSESGELTGSDPCDAVFVHVDFDQAQRLSYVLQEGGGWSNPTGFGCGGILLTPHPLLLNPREGVYTRNLRADAEAAGLDPAARVSLVGFEVSEHGEATFDDIVIFRAR